MMDMSRLLQRRPCARKCEERIPLPPAVQLSHQELVSASPTQLVLQPDLRVQQSKDQADLQRRHDALPNYRSHYDQNELGEAEKEVPHHQLSKKEEEVKLVVSAVCYHYERPFQELDALMGLID